MNYELFKSIKTMKKQLVLFVSILLCVSSCATAKNSESKENNGNNGNTPYLTREFPASSIKEVEATTSGGSLMLTGDAVSKAVVEVYVSRDNWSNEKIKQVLDDNYTLDIKVVDGKLYAVAKQKKNINNWDSKGLSISFKISVPKQVNSNMQTSGGGIQISNLSGSQDFKTSGGSLMVDNVSGSITGATSGGGISVTNSKDNIDLKTSGGSIIANGCSGTINLATSGGGISLNNLTGKIDAVTSGGSIMANNISGTLTTATSGGSVSLEAISGNLEAKTSGGNMIVKIKSANEYVRLSNSGNLNLVLPAGKNYNLSVKANKIDVSGLQNFSGSQDNSRLEGTIGSGGTEVTVKSSQWVWLSFE